MNDVAAQRPAQAILVEDVFPHAPELLWRALTTGELIGRWLMAPSGFTAAEGSEFTFQTTPAPPWDGVIHCRVLEVVPLERFAFAWRGGHEANVGYGSLLDTVVTFELHPVQGGTRLRLTHTGFVLPRNETAFCKMSEGWPKVIRSVAGVADDLH